MTETEMSKYVEIMLKLLTETKEFDGKLVFKAAKQITYLGTHAKKVAAKGKITAANIWA